MSPNIILIDAEHLDAMTFEMIVNFERMLGRRIPTADLPNWLDYIVLDSGFRPGENTFQAVFIHRKESAALQHFSPSRFAEDLHEKAFKDTLGEFQLPSYPIEPIVSREDFLVETFEALLLDPKVEHVMLVADLEGEGESGQSLLPRIKQLCATRPIPEGADAPLPRKDITLFAMQPISGRGFQSEIVGYSLTAALGVRSGEFA